MRTAKTLIRLGAQPHCWFCHKVAQIVHAHDECYRNKNLATSRENVSSGIFDQVTFKPACSVREASQNLETLDIASVRIILPKQRTTKVLIRLLGCSD